VRETHLFILKENPFEYISEHGKKDTKLTDLAEDPAYADKLKEMEVLLLDEMRRHNDPYRSLVNEGKWLQGRRLFPGGGSLLGSLLHLIDTWLALHQSPDPSNR